MYIFGQSIFPSDKVWRFCTAKTTVLRVDAKVNGRLLSHDNNYIYNVEKNLNKYLQYQFSRKISVVFELLRTDETCCNRHGMT